MSASPRDAGALVHLRRRGRAVGQFEAVCTPELTAGPVVFNDYQLVASNTRWAISHRVSNIWLMRYVFRMGLDEEEPHAAD
jgi:hypothetical protein